MIFLFLKFVQNFSMGVVDILKKSNRHSFVLLETVMALSITLSCIFLVSHGNLYLLTAEKQNNQEILLLRRLYEDVKTYRMYEQIPNRTLNGPDSQTTITAKKKKIEKVKLTQGDKVIEITKIPE